MEADGLVVAERPVVGNRGRGRDKGRKAEALARQVGEVGEVARVIKFAGGKLADLGVSEGRPALQGQAPHRRQVQDVQVDAGRGDFRQGLDDELGADEGVELEVLEFLMEERSVDRQVVVQPLGLGAHFEGVDRFRREEGVGVRRVGVDARARRSGGAGDHARDGGLAVEVEPARLVAPRVGGIGHHVRIDPVGQLEGARDIVVAGFLFQVAESIERRVHRADAKSTDQGLHRARPLSLGDAKGGVALQRVQGSGARQGRRLARPARGAEV